MRVMRFGVRTTKAVVTVAGVGALGRFARGGHSRRFAGTNMRVFGNAVA